MPATFARLSGTLAAFLLFIMFIAGLSKVLRTKESPALIRNGANALSNLFKGVLK